MSTPEPPVLSVQVHSSSTSWLVQVPAGWLRLSRVIIGAVLSMSMSVTVSVAVLPALSAQVPVEVWFSPSVLTVA